VPLLFFYGKIHEFTTEMQPVRNVISTNYHLPQSLAARLRYSLWRCEKKMIDITVLGVLARFAFLGLFVFGVLKWVKKRWQ
jgi:hypothetical protein